MTWLGYKQSGLCSDVWFVRYVLPLYILEILAIKSVVAEIQSGARGTAKGRIFIKQISSLIW